MTSSSTYTALATLDDAAQAHALADALEALDPQGVGCFEIEDGSGRWEVGGYFGAAPDDTTLTLLAAAHGATPFVVSRLDDRDWVAQVRRELTPVEAGRFVVHGAHDRERIPANRISLEIEAAMAFGTGHHGTTEGCLLALEQLTRRGLVARRVADVGCGTGVLAMAAAKLRPGKVIASDIDQIAVATAQANARANGLGARIRTRAAAGFQDAALHAGAPYDLVFMNILARPLLRLAPPAAAHMTPGGVVVLSGLLIRQAAMVSSRYRALGFAPLFRIERRGWTTLALRLRRSGNPPIRS